MLPVLAFLFLGIVWGSNFIYMKLASSLITPTQVLFLRVLFGFLPVFCYALYTKSLNTAQLKYSLHFLVMSVIATTLYLYCFIKGTSLLHSGVAGAVSGAIPLFVFVLSLLFLRDEKISVLRFLGVLIGFLGVFLIGAGSGEEVRSTNLPGVLYMVAGSLSVGSSFVYAKKYITHHAIPSSALATYQLGFALILLMLFTDYKGMSLLWTDVYVAVGLVVGLGLLGTGFAYIVYYYIVSSLGAVTASSVTYIPPVVALIIGGVFVGEPIGGMECFSVGLILLGVFLLKKGGPPTEKLATPRNNRV